MDEDRSRLAVYETGFRLGERGGEKGSQAVRGEAVGWRFTYLAALGIVGSNP